jgi:AcrR family transcriptional regulator
MYKIETEMTKKVSKGDGREGARRELILATAMEKLRRFGIRRVTMDELARELRISKKTLYRHFPEKEDLVRAVTETIAGTLLPKIAQILDSRRKPVEKVLEVWRVFSQLPRHVSPELMADLKADYPHLWAEIDRRRRGVIRRLEGLIEEGKESGDVRPEVHPKAAMAVLFAIVDQVLQPDVLSSGEFSPGEAIRTVLTILTRGMLTTPVTVTPEIFS